MSKAAWGAIVALALAVAAGGGYWLGHQNVAVRQRGGGRHAARPATKGGPARRPGCGDAGRDVARVESIRLQQSITAVGSLRSDESVTLRPEVAGRIATIQFQEGQRVAKGATLVRLDAAVNEAELQQARANHTLAKSKFDRAVDLAKSNFISGQARDEAESNFKVAEAAQALVEARLAKMEIKAPFSGIIGLRSVSVGDYVKEGADLVNLESIDALKVDFRVPEVYLRQVQSGQPLEITLDAYPNKTFEGQRAGGEPAARRRRALGGHPRAGEEPGCKPSARHVRARPVDHEGRRRGAGRARAGARPAGQRAVRVQGRGQPRRARRRSMSASAATARRRSCWRGGRRRSS